MNTFAESAKISNLADIEESSRGTKITIGENSVIDSFVKIKTVGGEGDITIGNKTYINSGCVLYSGNGISIGDHVLVASNCTFAPVNHEFKDKDKLIIEQRFQPSRGGIVIEDDVWIGANCVILDGAIIRKGCVIGAGSLVSGELEPYSICHGTPAQVRGQRK